MLENPLNNCYHQPGIIGTISLPFPLLVQCKKHSWETRPTDTHCENVRVLWCLRNLGQIEQVPKANLHHRKKSGNWKNMLKHEINISWSWVFWVHIIDSDIHTHTPMNPCLLVARFQKWLGHVKCNKSNKRNQKQQTNANSKAHLQRPLWHVLRLWKYHPRKLKVKLRLLGSKVQRSCTQSAFQGPNHTSLICGAQHSTILEERDHRRRLLSTSVANVAMTNTPVASCCQLMPINVSRYIYIIQHVYSVC